MSSMFDFNKITNFSETNGTNESLIIKCIDYLNKFSSDVSKIFHDSNASDALQCIVYIISRGTFDQKWVESKNFESFLANLMNYFYKIRNDLHFDTNLKIENGELNKKMVLTLANIMYTQNLIFRRSKKFCIEFVQKQGLAAYFSFLKDESFISKNKNILLIDFSQDAFGLLDYLALNLSSLSVKTVDDLKDIWTSFDPVKTLLNLAKTKESTLSDAYMILCHVLDDKQIESLTEIHLIADLMSSSLKKCSNNFDKNERSKRQIIFKGKPIDCSVQVVTSDENVSTSMIVLLDALYKLSVNDKLKNDIYFRCGMKDCFKTFITKGNFIEINFSLELLAQLSFSESVSAELVKNIGLIEIFNSILDKDLENISDLNEKEVYENIKTLIKQIKWNMKERIQNPQVKLESLENENGGHIMISYNTGSRPLCLKIKERLESLGYKVWIDVNDIHGSSLEAMAQAVENSSCILMCVTEKYRQSINCQAEAQYAFKMNKKIIPIIMQSGYENVKGWLGIIMGDKIFINFMKYEYEECIRRLKNELDSSLKKVKAVVNHSQKSHVHPDLSTNLKDSSSLSHQKNDYLIEEWTDIQVKNWFNENNLNLAIYNYLKPESGSILKQIYQMKSNATEFYYQLMSKIDLVKIHEVLKFSSCLDKLFEKIIVK